VIPGFKEWDGNVRCDWAPLLCTFRRKVDDIIGLKINMEKVLFEIGDPQFWKKSRSCCM
jgi:hypothetical protein